MKRINSIGIGAVLVAALAIPAAPAVAHGHHAKRGHKARHHVVFSHRANHRLTISDAGDPKVADRIGTIASFNATDGTLTIKLDSGKTVDGTVNDGTEIKCMPAPTPAPTTSPTVARTSDHGDDSSDVGDDNGDNSGSGSYPGSGDYPGGSGRHGGHCDHSDSTPCTTADLVEGAVVREAELKLTSDGLVFDEIKLVK